MKVLICFVVSLVFHAAWWLYPSAEPLRWQGGEVAHKQADTVQSLAIAFTTPVIKQQAQPVPEPQAQPRSSKAKKELPASSEFNSSKAKLKTTKPQPPMPEPTTAVAKTTAKPTHSPEPKKMAQDQVQEKEPPTPQKTEETVKHTDADATQLATAKQLNQQNSVSNTPVRLDELPLFKSPRPPLSYPLRAKRRGLEGISVFEIELNTQGEIVQLTLLKSSGYDSLDRAAKENVKQWQFHPVKQNGHAVKAQFTVPIEFKLT